MQRLVAAGGRLAELFLLLLVLGALYWQFQGLASGSVDAPPDDRYALDRALQPGPIAAPRANLSTLCHRLSLPPRLAWRWQGLCDATNERDAGSLEALPGDMAADLQAVQAAIAQGETLRLARVAPLAKSQAEGVLPEDDQALLNRTTSELNLYRSRYRLGDGQAAADRGSLLIDCAWRAMEGMTSSSEPDTRTAVLLANRLALVRGSPARLWWPQPLSAAPAAGGPGTAWPTALAPRCAGLGLPQTVVRQAADLVRQVREGGRLARKADAMGALLQRAPWLLAGWSLLAWLLISLGRLTRHPARFIGLAALAWAGAGMASGLVLPATGQAVPWWAWLGLAGGGLALTYAGRGTAIERMRLFAPCPAHRSLSVVSLPLVVLFIGSGWWLVMDLAMNGHLRNRYIGLAQALPVFCSLVLLSVLPVLSHGLAGAWIAWCSLVTNALRPTGGDGWRVWLRPIGLWLVYGGLVVGLAVIGKNWRQFTGDAFRAWLLLGVSWFFMLRAARWAQPSGLGRRAHLVSLLPLLVHLAVVMLALLVTDDLGPLLVVLFAAAVYVGAFHAQGMLGRGTAWLPSATLGLVAAGLACAVLLGGLFAFSKLPISPAQRVADRVESVLDPFSAENDQLAHVMWFRQHTPPGGYGLGAVPWCGTLPAANCPGMPAQTQSDYTFTALQGVVGQTMGFALLGLYLVWLGLLAARQAALTAGGLATRTPGATEAAWLAWLAVCWVVLTVVQTCVTVMGNLGTLPLTGVTWPFMSFGTWSMVLNACFLGLAMHRLETSE